MITAELALNRRTGVGGSDSPMLLNESPYGDALACYVSKVGTIVKPETEQLYWGNVIEKSLAEHFSNVHGVSLTEPRETMRHAEYPFLLGHLDRILSSDEGWEAKNVDRSKAGRWGKSGSGEVADDCYIQCQHYMGLRSFKRFWVSVLIGGNTYREYVIERDDRFIADIFSVGIRFWNEHVIPRKPPPIVIPAVEAVKKLYPGTDGTTVNISALDEWHRTRLDALDAVKTNKARAELAETHLRMALGNAAIGTLPGGQYERKTIHRSAYSVDEGSYERFQFIKDKVRK